VTEQPPLSTDQRPKSAYWCGFSGNQARLRKMFYLKTYAFVMHILRVNSPFEVPTGGVTHPRNECYFPRGTRHNVSVNLIPYLSRKLLEGKR